MPAELVDVAVSIVRFVDDYQPGIVACELIDADGRAHTFIDKAPVFTDELLDASSSFTPGPESPAAPLCEPGATRVDET